MGWRWAPTDAVAMPTGTGTFDITSPEAGDRTIRAAIILGGGTTNTGWTKTVGFFSNPKTGSDQQFCVFSHSQDAAGTSNTGHGAFNNAGVSVIDHDGTFIGYATVAPIAGGIRLTWTMNGAANPDDGVMSRLGAYFLIDDPNENSGIDADLDKFDMSGFSAGSVRTFDFANLTGKTVDQSFYLLAKDGFEAANTTPTVNPGLHESLGMASDNGNGIVQSGYWFNEIDNLGTTEVETNGWNTRVIGTDTGATPDRPRIEITDHIGTTAQIEFTSRDDTWPGTDADDIVCLGIVLPSDAEFNQFSGASLSASAETISTGVTRPDTWFTLMPAQASWDAGTAAASTTIEKPPGLTCGYGARSLTLSGDITDNIGTTDVRSDLTACWEDSAGEENGIVWATNESLPNANTGGQDGFPQNNGSPANIIDNDSYAETDEQIRIVWRRTSTRVYQAVVMQCPGNLISYPHEIVSNLSWVNAASTVLTSADAPILFDTEMQGNVAELDEITTTQHINDADNNAGIEFRFGPVPDPGDGEAFNFTVVCWARKEDSAGRQRNLEVSFRAGAAVLNTQTVNDLLGDWVRFEVTPDSATEMDSVDFTDLRVRFTSTATGGGGPRQVQVRHAMLIAAPPGVDTVAAGEKDIWAGVAESTQRDLNATNNDFGNLAILDSPDLGGHIPKAAIVGSIHRQSTTQDSSWSRGLFALGLPNLSTYNPPDQMCIFGFSEDGTTTTNTSKAGFNDAVAFSTNGNAGTDEDDMVLKVKRFYPNALVLRVDIGGGTENSRGIELVGNAYGGADVKTNGLVKLSYASDAQDSTKTADFGNLAPNFVTGLAIEDALVAANSLPTWDAHNVACFGYAVDNGAIEQASLSWEDVDNAGAGNVGLRVDADGFLRNHPSTTSPTYEVTSFTAGGSSNDVEITVRDSAAPATMDMIIMAIEFVGTDDLTVDVLNHKSAATTGTVDYDHPGYKPVSVLIAASRVTAIEVEEEVGANAHGWSEGFSARKSDVSAPTEAAIKDSQYGYSSDSGSNPSEVLAYNDFDDAVSLLNPNDNTARVDEYRTNGFGLDHTVNGNANRKWIFVTVGINEVGGDQNLNASDIIDAFLEQEVDKTMSGHVDLFTPVLEQEVDKIMDGHIDLFVPVLEQEVDLDRTLVADTFTPVLEQEVDFDRTLTADVFTPVLEQNLDKIMDGHVDLDPPPFLERFVMKIMDGHVDLMDLFQEQSPVDIDIGLHVDPLVLFGVLPGEDVTAKDMDGHSDDITTFTEQIPDIQPVVTNIDDFSPQVVLEQAVLLSIDFFVTDDFSSQIVLEQEVDKEMAQIDLMDTFVEILGDFDRTLSDQFTLVLEQEVDKEMSGHTDLFVPVLEQAVILSIDFSATDVINSFTEQTPDVSQSITDAVTTFLEQEVDKIMDGHGEVFVLVLEQTPDVSQSATDDFSSQVVLEQEVDKDMTQTDLINIWLEVVVDFDRTGITDTLNTFTEQAPDLDRDALTDVMNTFVDPPVDLDRTLVADTFTPVLEQEVDKDMVQFDLINLFVESSDLATGGELSLFATDAITTFVDIVTAKDMDQPAEVINTFLEQTPNIEPTVPPDIFTPVLEGAVDKGMDQADAFAPIIEGPTDKAMEQFDLINIFIETSFPVVEFFVADVFSGLPGEAATLVASLSAADVINTFAEAFTLEATLSSVDLLNTFIEAPVDKEMVQVDLMAGLFNDVSIVVGLGAGNTFTAEISFLPTISGRIGYEPTLDADIEYEPTISAQVFLGEDD